MGQQTNIGAGSVYSLTARQVYSSASNIVLATSPVHFLSLSIIEFSAIGVVSPCTFLRRTRPDELGAQGRSTCQAMCAIC